MWQDVWDGVTLKNRLHNPFTGTSSRGEDDVIMAPKGGVMGTMVPGSPESWQKMHSGQKEGGTHADRYKRHEAAQLAPARQPMTRQSDFLDLLWEIGQGAGQGAASNAGGVWDFISNPNSLGRQKLRAEQEGRQLISGSLPPSAAIPGTGPTGNQVGVDYSPNEPGLQGNPNIWSSEHITPPTRARDAALEEMAQQYDPNYWDRKENEAIRAATLADADRTDGTVRVTSDMEGYEDRADIQAWLAANPGLKDQFLADRARKAEAGLLQENPNLAAENYSPTGEPGFGADDIDWIEALYGDKSAKESAPDEFLQQRTNQLKNLVDAAERYYTGDPI